MAAFTEMGPGASLHYLMNGSGGNDQQNVAANHQAHSYAFMYGAPPQLVPSYQQQQPVPLQQPRSRQPGLPPTPPGSPRPLNTNNAQQQQHQQNAQQLQVQSAVKQQPASTFTSPVRTQHPSQPQSLPLYPQPSPLHPNMQNMGNAENGPIFLKQQQPLQQQQQPLQQQQQQSQQMFQSWQNQMPTQPTQIVIPQQTSNPVPTLYSSSTDASTNAFPVVPSSTSPSLVHALSQAAQQRRQRSEKKQVPDDLKDDKYYERRKRNNVAAKKSRDSRKAREDEISIRASFLEKENAILRAQVATLRDEASSLRQLLLQKQVPTGGQQNALGGPRPAATSTPNGKQAFNLAPQGQPGQHNSLAATIAQQAAAAYAAFASSNMSNMHHHNQNQQQPQQEIINSAA